MSGDISLEAKIVNSVNRLGVNADRHEARDAPEGYRRYLDETIDLRMLCIQQRAFNECFRLCSQRRKHMNDNEDISLFATVPEGLTQEEFLEWFDNLSDEDFVPLIID